MTFRSCVRTEPLPILPFVTFQVFKLEDTVGVGAEHSPSPNLSLSELRRKTASVPCSPMTSSPASAATRELKLTPSYRRRQQAALRQVGSLLRRFEAFQRLYPTTATMASLLEEEFDSTVEERLFVLYVWYNTSTDICRQIRDVGHTLGLDKVPFAAAVADVRRPDWPYADYARYSSILHVPRSRGRS